MVWPLKRLQRIEDVLEPKVGGRYLVRTGIADGGTIWTRQRLRLVPLLGPVHEDREIINFPDYHFHIDWRFVKPRVFEAMIREQEVSIGFDATQKHYPPRLQMYEPAHLLMAMAAVAGGNIKRDVHRYRPMTLYREHAVFPDRVRWLGSLEAKYASAKLRPNLVCPHRGISCAGVTCSGDGLKVVCPGHGLAWNRETGELIRRTT